MTGPVDKAGRGGPIGDVSTTDDDLSSRSASTEMIPVLAETVVVSKRRVTTGKVRVSTRTVAADEVVAVDLQRSVVEVTRVPVGRVVAVAPDVRVEGDTTIVPVVEERLVVVKQLVLVEEVHIRRRAEQQTARQPVSLRRQHVVVERFDPEGRPTDRDTK